MKTRRVTGIDVLRGVAIVGMILSGTISRNAELPAWLFHAQLPPPDFQFNADLPGITWVDLVFPFFLFAMGLSFPFALGRLVEKGTGKGLIVQKTIFRSLKLFVFAVLLAHLSPFHYPQELGWLRYLAGVMAFAGFFMAFSKWQHITRFEKQINMAGYALLVALLIIRYFVWDLPFSIHKHDIIILVLANMALFGALIWFLTRENLLLRLGIMAVWFAIHITHSVDGSVNEWIWQFSFVKIAGEHIPAFHNAMKDIGVDTNRIIFYSSNFLKYLMIIIPGSIAGDLLYKGTKEVANCGKKSTTLESVALVMLVFVIVGVNLWGLLVRNLWFVWLVNISGSLLLYRIMKTHQLSNLRFHRKILLWSIFWLVLGLVFEAWQGGIKKDHATISYFFLTSGLSGMCLAAFHFMLPLFEEKGFLRFFTLTGMNPMVGYVVSSFFVMPMLYFLQLLPLLDQWHLSWNWGGLIRGLMITALSIIVTVVTVRFRFFWKT